MVDVFDKILNGMRMGNPDEYDDEDDFEDDEPMPAKTGGFFHKSKKNVMPQEDDYDYDYDEEEDSYSSLQQQSSQSKLYGSSNSASSEDSRSRMTGASSSVSVSNTAKNQKKNNTRKVGNKIMAMKTPERLAEVTVKVPHSEEDANECVELLLQGNAVLLNFEGLSVDHAQRVIDFVSGACYATHGNFQKVANKLFIASPREVILSGDFLDSLGDGFTMPLFDVNG